MNSANGGKHLSSSDLQAILSVRSDYDQKTEDLETEMVGELSARLRLSEIVVWSVWNGTE